MKFSFKNYIPNQRRDDVLVKSYQQDNFCKNLGEDELETLRSHQVLYQKVIDELGINPDATIMADHFTSFFERIPEENKRDLFLEKFKFASKFYTPPSKVPLSQTQITLYDPSSWSQPKWTYLKGTPELTGGPDFTNLSAKMLISVQKDSNYFSNIRNGLLTENSDKINPEVLKYYIEGIQCNDVTSWDRYTAAVDLIANFFSKYLNSEEVSVMLEYCITNEKFMFLLFYPYFFNPLKKLAWTYLLPVFHTKVHSFTQFIKNVALKLGNIISHQTAVVCGFKTLKMSRNFRLAIGTTSLSSLLLLYNSYFISQNQVIVRQLYSGLSGPLGDILGGFRLEGSKIIYEVAKTFSTFTNAAVAGFLEPKNDVVRQMVSIFKKK